jgi:hypothetical protein
MEALLTPVLPLRAELPGASKRTSFLARIMSPTPLSQISSLISTPRRDSSDPNAPPLTPAARHWSDRRARVSRIFSRLGGTKSR